MNKIASIIMSRFSNFMNSYNNIFIRGKEKKNSNILGHIREFIAAHFDR